MGAFSRSLRSLALLFLLFRVGQSQTSDQALAFASMAADRVLEMIFINRHVRTAIPPQRKGLFHYARAVDLLGSKEPAIENANRTRTEAVNDLPTSGKTRLVETFTAPPMTQGSVRVSTPGAGLCLLKSNPRTAMPHLTLTAQDVMDVIFHQHSTVCFNISGTNLSTCLNTPLSALHCLRLQTI